MVREDRPAEPSQAGYDVSQQRIRKALAEVSVSRETDPLDGPGGAAERARPRSTGTVYGTPRRPESYDEGAALDETPAARGSGTAAVPAPLAGERTSAVPTQPSGAVSRETDLDDDDLPLAMEARRAVQILNPSGAALIPRPAHRRIMCIANQKGGVGKTTTAVNIAVALALHGSRVMVIDLDPQGNASTGLSVEHHAGLNSIYDCLTDGLPLAEAAQTVEGIPNLLCVPATIDLAGAEIEMVSVVARESRLKRAIAAYQEPLDYVFIDCPPSLGLLTVNALVAAEEVLIPIQCEYYALEGLGQLLRNVELVKAHLNPSVWISTILLTMYDGRTKLADQVAQEVREHFGDVVLDAVIPRSVRVSEAPGYGQSVLTYDPGSRGSTSYFDAAKQLAERGAAAGGKA
ncbi:hypothetical protein Asera_11610 [Actinocatenispora sera]|uniref:AAA domain-containing protein n=1 Tax=Actinocatenispora sera TaxID=390989 RepID=A0A810KUZ7_9ACTN|nr:hypothetical protein Asera_11610 [Actinocatenispora sera]